MTSPPVRDRRASGAGSRKHRHHRNDAAGGNPTSCRGCRGTNQPGPDKRSVLTEEDDDTTVSTGSTTEEASLQSSSATNNRWRWHRENDDDDDNDDVRLLRAELSRGRQTIARLERESRARSLEMSKLREEVDALRLDNDSLQRYRHLYEDARRELEELQSELELARQMGEEGAGDLDIGVGTIDRLPPRFAACGSSGGSSRPAVREVRVERHQTAGRRPSANALSIASALSGSIGSLGAIFAQSDEDIEEEEVRNTAVRRRHTFPEGDSGSEDEDNDDALVRRFSALVTAAEDAGRHAASGGNDDEGEDRRQQHRSLGSLWFDYDEDRGEMTVEDCSHRSASSMPAAGGRQSTAGLAANKAQQKRGGNGRRRRRNSQLSQASLVGNLWSSLSLLSGRDRNGAGPPPPPSSSSPSPEEGTSSSCGRATQGAAVPRRETTKTSTGRSDRMPGDNGGSDEEGDCHFLSWDDARRGDFRDDGTGNSGHDSAHNHVATTSLPAEWQEGRVLCEWGRGRAENNRGDDGRSRAGCHHPRQLYEPTPALSGPTMPSLERDNDAPFHEPLRAKPRPPRGEAAADDDGEWPPEKPRPPQGKAAADDNATAEAEDSGASFHECTQERPQLPRGESDDNGAGEGGEQGAMTMTTMKRRSTARDVDSFLMSLGGLMDECDLDLLEEIAADYDD